MESRHSEFFALFGMNPAEFTIERYRGAGQLLNENGRACRVSHVSGNVVVVDTSDVYALNENRAVERIVHLVDGQPGQPIEDLMALYESEGCDFEDGKQMARNILAMESNLPDSHLRCLMYGLANIVNGTPWRRPKPLKVPVKSVEILAAAFKQHLSAVIVAAQKEFNVDLSMTTSLRTIKLKSGVTKKLYGKITGQARTLERGRAPDYRVIGRRITELIQEIAGLDYRPALYTTSGSNRLYSFEHTIRLVSVDEDDYATWKKF